jgi:hypothetical protein
LSAVNFLSHGLLVRKMDSAEMLIGTALPDLAPLADRQLRLTARRLDRLHELGAEAVTAGCRHHREVDRVFHHGAPFHRARHAVEDVIGEGALPLWKPMLAHMLVEIGIDAEVLQRHPRFARHTYPDAFDRFDWDGLMAQLEQVCEAPTTALSDLVDRFDRGAFLLSYETDEGILDRIDGMGQRLKRGPLGEAGRALLAPAVAVCRQQGRDLFDELVPWSLEVKPDAH